MFKAFALRSEEVEREEEELRASVRELDESQKKIFYNFFSKKVKDPDTYATLNAFVFNGLHHFYLKKYIRDSINLFLFFYALTELFSLSHDGQ